MPWQLPVTEPAWLAPYGYEIRGCILPVAGPSGRCSSSAGPWEEAVAELQLPNSVGAAEEDRPSQASSLQPPCCEHGPEAALRPGHTCPPQAAPRQEAKPAVAQLPPEQLAAPDEGGAQAMAPREP